MGVSYEYDASLGELIKDLEKLRKTHGSEARVQLARPGFYDPYFDGRKSKLTAEFRNTNYNRGAVVIVEKDIK